MTDGKFNPDYLGTPEKDLKVANWQIEELREVINKLSDRLELSPDHEYDAIDTRDEAIRLLEANRPEVVSIDTVIMMVRAADGGADSKADADMLIHKQFPNDIIVRSK